MKALKDDSQMNVSDVQNEMDSKLEDKSDIIEKNFSIDLGSYVNLQFKIEKESVVEVPPTIQAKYLFYLFFVLQIFLNLDQGVFPVSIESIKNDLHIDDVQVGFFGSAEYIGLILGSFVGGSVYDHFNAKKTLIFSQFGMIFSTQFWIWVTNYGFLCFSRVISGFFQVFIGVYIPVWIDLHGKKKKTIWLTLIQITVSLGVIFFIQVFFGYVITSLIQRVARWNTVFLLQMCICLPIIFIIMKKSNHFFVLKKSQQSQKRQSQYFDRNKSFIIDTVSNNEVFSRNADGTSSKPFRYLDLLTNVQFMTSSLSICTVYFVVTGIQYWMTQYLISAVNIERYQVEIIYGCISISAPTLGVVVGGIITNKLGGYDSYKVRKFVWINALCASIFAFLFPFMEDIRFICFSIWIILFFGGACMPGIIGMMLSSVDQENRQYASGANQLIQNSLGYLPSPIVYGLLKQNYGHYYAMGFLMYWIGWIFILQTINLLYYQRQNKKKVLAKQEQYKIKENQTG